jgi:glycosyltransferase involved in cell wall biosynthesis
MTQKTEVTVLVTTCDRYDTTLPLCLMSIINQTYKPKRVVLVDDNKEKKFYEYEILRNILLLCKYKEIKFDYYQGSSKGCVHALDLGLKKIDGGWILKVDDDNVLEPNVIELYVSNISDNVGVLGGLIIDEKSIERNLEDDQLIYNRICDIYSEMNIQMITNQSDDIKEVEHVYSNYFFIKNADISHDLRLTPSSHREETVFTYQYFRKGYKLLIIPQSKTYHLNYNKTTGNNRHSKESSNKNELIFIEKLKEWEIVPNEMEIIELKDRYVTTIAEIGGQQAYIVMEK